MSIQDVQHVPPHSSPSGEIIRELGGLTPQNLGQHSVAHITLPPQRESRKHYHPHAEESYYILSGQAEVWLDDTRHDLSAGQLIAIRPQQLHQIRNTSPATNLVFLAICTPPWIPECSVFVDDPPR